MNWKDTLERLVWLTVLAMVTQVSGAAILNIEVWQAAALAGVQAALGFVALVAQHRLRALPDPGKFLADEVREQTTENIGRYLASFPKKAAKAAKAAKATK